MQAGGNVAGEERTELLAAEPLGWEGASVGMGGAPGVGFILTVCLPPPLAPRSRLWWRYGEAGWPSRMAW